MTQLIKAMSEVLQTEDLQQKLEAEHHFIEILTHSNFDEILAMLNQGLNEDWINLPVWMRNLAFRLACLLAPEDAEIRRRAAADLLCFGPDWDDFAKLLQQETDLIEKRKL